MTKSPSQNNYDERLAEKLALMASKRGANSAPAQELQTVTGAPVETPKSGTENKAKENK